MKHFENPVKLARYRMDFFTNVTPAAKTWAAIQTALERAEVVEFGHAGSNHVIDPEAVVMLVMDARIAASDQ